MTSQEDSGGGGEESEGTFVDVRKFKSCDYVAKSCSVNLSRSVVLMWTQCSYEQVKFP